MPGSHRRSSRSLTVRRWRIPTALAHGDDVLEGLSVLDDVPGELGIVLWQALRDASLWAAASPKARSGIFAANAEANRMAAVLSAPVPRELEAPLGVLAHMTGAPEAVGESNVSLALREISLWLDERGLLGSALAYAHAAAMVSAGDAATAFVVGRLARRRAEYVRAETWFRRAAVLARQSADWSSYARAFMGLGVLYFRRGNLPEAYRFRRRALQTVLRHALDDMRGNAHHDVFEVAMNMNREAEAQEQARLAFEGYGPGHMRLPMLAHDVAYFWMSYGGFERALPVFGSVLPHFSRADDRALVLACRARAAGGALHAEEFRQSWEELSRVRASISDERVATIMLEAARGALNVGEWRLAEDAADTALEAARRRSEGQVQLAIEAVLDQVRHRHTQRRADEPTLPTHLEDAADTLADDFVESLRLAESAF